MKRIKLLPVIGLLLCVSSHVNAALMFDFFWSSAGATPSLAGNSSIATGTWLIDALPGESFVNADVVSVDVTLTTVGPDAGSENFTTSFFNAGRIAADGLTASLTNFGLTGNVGNRAFLCPFFECSFDALEGTFSVNAFTNSNLAYTYPSQQAILDSFVLTASAVPLPGTLALSLLGFSAILLARRRHTLPRS
ncbi:MAG: hypothetical protein AAGI72_18465 [Pseudomonadota bacterium]